MVLMSTTWARRSVEMRIEWAEAEEPSFRDFKGRYRIKLYPRWLWCWFADIKIFYEDYPVCDEEGTYYRGIGGLNVAWGVVAWGKRIVVTRGMDALFVLNYKRAWWPWRIIRDYVRRKKDNSLIGRFHIQLPRIGSKQLAWFTMEKIQ